MVTKEEIKAIVDLILSIQNPALKPCIYKGKAATYKELPFANDGW